MARSDLNMTDLNGVEPQPDLTSPRASTSGIANTIFVQPAGQPPVPRKSRGNCRCNAQLLTVEPVLFLFTFALAMQMPAFSALVYRKICITKYNQVVCDNLGNASNHKAEDWVQSESSFWFLYFSFCFEIPAIFVSFFYGALSDRVNRRLTLALPCIGQTLSIIVFVLTSISLRSGVVFLIIGQIISGMFGGWITISLASFSYLSEVSSAKFRTTRTAIGEAVITLTISISYFIGGVIVDNTNYALVFAVSGGIYLSCLMYICFWLKEPEKEDPEGERPRVSFCSALNQFFSKHELKAAFFCLFRPREDNKRKKLLLLLAAVFTSMLSFTAMFSLGYLYVRRRPLNWSQTTYGLFIGYSKLLAGCFLVVAVPILKQKLEVADSLLILLAIVSSAAAELLFSLSRYTWMVFLVPVLGIMTDVRMTGLRSMLSSLVEPHELGKVFAAVGALQSLSGIVGSSLYNTIYPYTLAFWPGFCFLMGVIFCIIPMTIIGWIHWDSKRRDVYKDTTINSTEMIDMDTDTASTISRPITNQKPTHQPTLAFRSVQ